MHYLPKGLLKLLNWIFHFGVRPDMDLEEEQAINRSNLFYMLLVILGLIILEESLRVSVYPVFFVSLFVIAGAVGSFVVVAKTGRPFLPNIFLLTGLTLLFLILTAGGGVTGTNFIWFCIFPFLYFLVFPFRVSIIFFVLLLVGIASIFFIPDDPLLSVNYPMILRQRVFLACIFCGCAALANEFIRWQSQQKISLLLKELRQASQNDMLTGLFNRRVYLERLAYEITRSKREKTVFSLVMFDIDHFKNINDTYGHNCGDTALRLLAEDVRPLIRQQDTLARWGGEEFLVLLPGTDAAGGAVLAEKLRSSVEAATCVCGTVTFGFTISLGVHLYDLNESRDTNLSNVDANLYRAKSSGRNRVCGAPDA